MKKLCIAIPTYNRAEQLNRCLSDLRGLISQSIYKDQIEVLVSDNGSDDGTQRILSSQKIQFEIDAIKIIILKNDENLGFDKNLLLCFEEAESEYIWFLSDDDLIRVDAINFIFKDINSFNPNIILYNYNQFPHDFSNPYIRENKYFDAIDQSNLESIAKLVLWPKMTSIVLKSNKQLKIETKKIFCHWMHLGLFIYIGLNQGKILHSKFFLAGVNSNYLEEIDYMPFVGNLIKDSVSKIFIESGQEELLKTYIKYYPFHYEKPILSCLKAKIYSNKYGIPLKKKVEEEIDQIIKYELYSNKFIKLDKSELKIVLNYYLSYIYVISYKIFYLRSLKNFYKKIKNKSILNEIKRIIRDSIKFYPSIKSYSQSGEDIIIDNALQFMNIKSNIYYLDIGANHPFYLSNSYFFYKKGGKGVCIEPDPKLAEKYIKARPRDQILNLGISCNNEKFSDLYIMSADVLNTFSYEESERVSLMGKYSVENSVRINMMDINEVFKNYLERVPDFMTIDVEGLDLKVLKQLDLDRYRPSVICIETLQYEEKGSPVKHIDIIEYMNAKNYSIYGDTHINTIFFNRLAK
jgi:FkbM family methyltransferase